MIPKRIIKFRALPEKSSEKGWVYGGISREEDGSYIYQQTPEIARFRVNKDTIGQFSGIYSVDTKAEVYEGDVIAFTNADDNTPHTGIVVYDSDSCQFVVMNKNSMNWMPLCGARNIKIVGNCSHSLL